MARCLRPGDLVFTAYRSDPNRSFGIVVGVEDHGEPTVGHAELRYRWLIMVNDRLVMTWFMSDYALVQT